MINVPADDWPLLVGWLVAALFPELPHPVLSLLGEHGSGKSSAARLLGGLIDPSPAQLRSAPRDVEGWAVAAAGTWVVGLDNISTVPDWFSDSLCRSVTGDGMVRRALYTDSGLSVLAFRRVVLLTSIDPGALRGDLADRLLAVQCSRIDDTDRLEEQQLAADWTAAHPRVLGALLDLTAQVLRVLPDIHLTRRPRMADFARILAAVDEVMGSDGLARYAGQATELAVEVVESDAVAAAVRALVPVPGDVVEHTAAELLEATSPERPGRDWPANPRALSARLKRAAPALRTVGVEVTHLPRAGHTSRRLWRIARQPENTGDLPSAPSAPSATAADLRKQADGRRADAAGADGRRAEPPNRQPLPAADHTPADLRKQSPADGADGADGRKPLPSDDDSRPGVAAWMPQREPVGPCHFCTEPAHTADELGRACHVGCGLPGALPAVADDGGQS
jgi:energy-coupling factor transporter ATP-binding protein EcfA2